MYFRVMAENGSMSNETFDFHWNQIVSLTEDLSRHNKYITQKDTDPKISHAQFTIEHFNPELDSMDNLVKAKSILKKYGISEEKTKTKSDIRTPGSVDTETYELSHETGTENAEKKSENKAQNFNITDDKLSEAEAKTKFKNNLFAIRTLKQIEEEERYATPEEQETLSKYVG